MRRPINYVLGMVHCNDLAQTVMDYLHSVDISTTPVHLPMCTGYMCTWVRARACVRTSTRVCLLVCVGVRTRICEYIRAFTRTRAC